MKAIPGNASDPSDLSLLVTTMQVTDWLQKRSILSPNHLAVADLAHDRRLTYSEFNDSANRIASFLQRELRIGKGNRVSVLATNRAECLECFFAASKIGAVYTPLNYKLSPPELAALLHDSEPRVLIYSSDLTSLVESIVRDSSVEYLLSLDANGVTGSRSLKPLLDSNDVVEPEPTGIDYEDPQMILYTSGTTGAPKGVVLSHRMIVWNCFNTMLRDLLPTDSTLIHTPLFYTGGLNVYTNPLFLVGGVVYLTNHWDAEEVLRIIERERITIMFAVPTQFYMLVHSTGFEKADLSSLRFVISGGAPCPIPIIEAFQNRGVTFKQGFGMTEVGVNCFCLDADYCATKAGSIGTPNFFVDARIVDDNYNDVGPNDIGELLLRSPAMFSEYWKKPAETAEVMHDGWVRTGDLARRDEEGFFFIVDRKKDMFISGGENVYPAEIERVLSEHPAVAEVAVVGVAHEKWGEVGAAFVVLKENRSSSPQELLEFCASKLSRYKLPKSVTITTSLPRGKTGKVLKADLREWFAAGAAKRADEV